MCHFHHRHHQRCRRYYPSVIIIIIVVVPMVMIITYYLSLFFVFRGRSKETIEKAMGKASQKKFFLGLDRAWLGH